MSRSLADLSSQFRPVVLELLGALVETRIPVIIVDTLRTPAEQAVNIANNASWTANSLHLPDVSGKANAIDLAPYHQYLLHGPDKVQWDASDPVWATMGRLGKALQLEWGGDWGPTPANPKLRPDLGHFQLPRAFVHFPTVIHV
jgi:hypothetical protein